MIALTGYADRTALIPLIQPGEEPGPVNRTGEKLAVFEAFVVHETGNEDAGATAEMHHDYWSPGGAGRFLTSVQFVADATESIQLIPIDERAWHAGDAHGNATGVGVEICVNDRLRFPIACAKAAAIGARVLRAEGKTPSDGATVRKHGSYPGTTHKLCPAHLNKGDWGVTWAQFIQMLNQAYVALGVTPDYRAIWGRVHPEIAYNPAFGFPQHWRAELDAGRSLGAVLSPELGDQIVWQVFELGVLRLVKATGQITAIR